MIRLLVAALFFGLLVGCAGRNGGETPIGTGDGMDELPASPCACQIFYRNGQWLG